MLCEATPEVTVNVVVNVPAALGANSITTAPFSWDLIANASSPSSTAEALKAFSRMYVAVTLATSPTKISSNTGAWSSLITGFKIALALKLMLSVTTPSAVIVSVPANVPASVGANLISTAPLASLTTLNTSSPLNTTSTSVAFWTENVAVPFAVSPTYICVNSGATRLEITGTGHVSHALITEFKPEVRFVTQDFNELVLTDALVELPLNTVFKLSILAFRTVELSAPSAAIYLAQRSFTIALNLQSPRIPLQPDFPLPVHQNGVGKSSL